jgi:hypothetical protein
MGRSELAKVESFNSMLFILEAIGLCVFVLQLDLLRVALLSINEARY